MSFILKRLTLNDMDRATMVVKTSFDKQLPWLTGLHTLEEDRIYFRDHVFPTCTVWGALDGEVMVGIIAFRASWIDQLYVLPSHQGQGVGTALLDVAKTAEASLRLWTFQRNETARRFYEARGFVAVERTDGSANEEREPDVLYRWEKVLGVQLAS